MRRKPQILFVVVCLLVLAPVGLYAQKYSVAYKNTPIEQVITDLRKKTGYEFVYQKQIIQGAGSVTATYKRMTLEQLLNRIICDEAELDYDIVGKTVVLSKPKHEQSYYKQVLTGIVTDEDGEVLPGASIRVLGTETGTITDMDGQFSVIIEGRQPVLRVSYISMKDKDVAVNRGKDKFLMITLQSDTKQLNEVVVTGYQKLKRENATGAYNTISAAEMENRYSGSIVSNLEGKVPGLISYNNGLNDGGETAMTIRGVGSFNAKTNPLVVVDGLPIEGSIESVNPYEIDKITVLKDASAAAIYGARASNGVIVITTKQAKSGKLQVDFNADLTISEKNDYSNFGWASAAEMIELEQYNFNYIKNAADQSAMNSLLDYYNNQRGVLSPVSRLLTANYLGELSDDELNSTLSKWSRNNYRKEWQDAYERTHILQQYNLALRTQGRNLASSIVLNYKGDNNGKVNEYNNAINMSYRGDLKAAPWLDLAFGVNILSERSKTRINELTGWGNIYSFQPYESMYNADGSAAELEADTYTGEESLQNSDYGFKKVTYNPLEEVGMNFEKTRRTNIRSFLHADFKILPEWRASAQFQYEDIYYKSDAYREADSYAMRNLYNLYTTGGTSYVYDEDWDEYYEVTNPTAHNIPDGGRLDTTTSEGAYWTFRAQTDYEKTFAGKHFVEAAAGFEFRQTRTKTGGNLLLGYDEQTQTNSNGLVNFGELKDIEGTTSALGQNYYLYGAPDGDSFTTTDVLHRFYSLYFTGGYTYDHRYAASLSYRVDKTDLFGADPEFRGRPLWSVGATWNAHNERFMKKYTWIDMLKLRLSYGLTGNIDQTVSSYLTATIGTNYINGSKQATLNTPPNDQLRWEKTASWNFGVDFAFLNNRIGGSLDIYRKKGSDLLTVTDLDPTTGWSQLTINNGEALNKGFELQLTGDIIRPARRNALGLRASLNFAYNKNEVTSVSHQPSSGYDNLLVYTLHEGYPVHSLFSYRYAGMVEQDGIQYFSWKDADGDVHTSDVSSEEFTVNDAVYSGSLDPKYTAGFTPEISYGGFSLSAMFSFYGGHYMRARVDDWSSDGYETGYSTRNFSNIDAVPSAYLNYWRSEDKTLYPANGYLGGSNVVGNYQYMDANVVHADYLKLRNIVLGYEFPRSVCRQLGINALRLRVQINNVCTWTRNNLGVDPEANNPASGTTLLRTPRSYTMSLAVSL